MEKSVIPVIRASTAPVLSYLLITLRDQTPNKMDPILKPAINLVNILKAQQPKDTVSINLKTELVEGLYILSEKRSVMSDKLNELLLKTLSVSNLFKFFVLQIHLFHGIYRNILDLVSNEYWRDSTPYLPYLIRIYPKVALNQLCLIAKIGWKPGL